MESNQLDPFNPKKTVQKARAYYLGILGSLDTLTLRTKLEFSALVYTLNELEKVPQREPTE